MAKQTIKCKIVDIEPIPAQMDDPVQAQLVSVEFTQGTNKWYKGFRLKYDRPISMEEFKKELIRVGIFPDDFLAYVKAEMKDEFTLELDA